MATVSQKWGIAWLALTVTFALHVWDEAAHGFLSVYNPNVRAIRARFPLLPLPTFTLVTFVGALMTAVVIVGLFGVAAFQGRRWARFIAYPYGVIMLLNGLQHIAASVYLGRFMPGVLSSPLLLITSVALLMQTRRAVLSSRSDG